MSRVLHVINGEHYSGAERVQDLLAMRLPEYGFEVEFVCIKPLNFAARRSSTVPLFATPMQSRLSWRIGRQIADLASSGGYKLLHSHSARSALAGWIAARLSGLPMVFHVHSPSRADSGNRRWDRLLTTMERISLAGADALIAVSDSVKRDLERQGFPPRRIHLVPNGVPARSGLGAWVRPEDRPWEIGVVALFRPRKGLEVLLDAVKQLREEGLQLRLRVVGSFESRDYEANVRQWAAAEGLGNVILWVGHVQDVHAQLARMDILAIPSLYGEGLPMVLLEGMAAGVPVVATEVGGISQAMRHGIDGVMVMPGIVQAMAGGLRSVIRGDVSPEALRHNAHLRQREQFSDRRMAQGVAAVYREVLRPR